MSQPGNRREIANDYLSASSTDVLNLFLQEKYLGITLSTPPASNLLQKLSQIKEERKREMLTSEFLF